MSTTVSILSFRSICAAISRASGALGLSLALANPAAAALPLLDDFSAPASGWTRTASGAPGSPGAVVRVCEAGLPVPGGARDVYHSIYGNPLASISALAAGEGRLSVAQGTGTTAETLVMYGAFTRVDCNLRVGGPRFALDLSAWKSLRLVFSGAEDALNLNVTYYTAAPLNPAAPVYYATNGINIAPAASGAALEAALAVNNDPAFNWKQVDGIVVIINRSGPHPHTSYTLQRLYFSP
jgi:hypothetical protein